MFFLFGCNEKNNTMDKPIDQQDQLLMNVTEAPFATTDTTTLEEALMNDQRAYHMEDNYFITDFVEESEPVFSIPSNLSSQLENLKDIAKAQVIVVGDKAYVALQTTDTLSPHIKQQVENVIKNTQADINDIIITTDSNLVDRFGLFVNKIENNVPLKEWYVDFATSIENILE